MLHELQAIIQQAILHQKAGLKSVLATVVALDGSSYRRPGVRMLISESGVMTGAVSGGCVEKEVARRAEEVFRKGEALVMTYDGRYRLGCKGTLYLLIEPFQVSDALFRAFRRELTRRVPLKIESYFVKQDSASGTFGSIIMLEGEKHPFHASLTLEPDFLSFCQELMPKNRLLIIGAEHDAVKLTSQAAALGWQVEVLCTLKDPKGIDDFPGAEEVSPCHPEAFTEVELDATTAVVLMTHNFALDLAYLMALSSKEFAYLGILGASQRREQLFEALLERKPSLEVTFLEAIHGPAGLNLGAETPEEIALSILAEILSVFRKKQPSSLRSLSGSIHAP